MPENRSNLPKVLKELGVAAWYLPAAAIRQMNSHSHPEAQLCGLDAGLAVMETEEGSWLCPPGRCIWIPPGTVHSLRSCGRISGWMLHMEANGTHALPTAPEVLALTPLLKEIVERIAEWASNPKPSAAKQRLLAVLNDEIADAPRLAFHLPVPRDSALKRLAEQLAGPSEDAKSLAALAREVGVSERSLFRRFQQETGMSPGQWRRQAQVLRSLELLADGRSVTETALEVGYKSTGAFIRAFREVIGETPAAYAKHQKSGTKPSTHENHNRVISYGF